VDSSSTLHVKLIVVALVVLILVVLVSKFIFTPASFGVYGYYRADAITDEVNHEIRYMTNSSCRPCHEHEDTNLQNGLHNTLSCEFCHAPNADHVSDNKKTANMPVKKEDEIKVLCLRCHNNSILARPKTIVKTIAMPDHLKDQKVQLTHICNQCHYVHSPLKYINRPKRAALWQENE
jgi:hypothetical protein